MAEGGSGSPDEAVAGGDTARRLRWELIVLATMYVGYVAFMLCQNTVIAASPAMEGDPTLGIDKERYGRLMSLNAAGSIAGKLVIGPLADVFGGRTTFVACLVLTAVATACFGLGSSLGWFMGLVFLIQFFKAGGWPAMAKVIGAWYPPSRYGRVWSVVSTASRVGTMLATIVLGWLLLSVSWRTLFFVSAGTTVLAAVLCLKLLHSHPRDVGLSDPASSTDPADDAGPPKVRPAHPLDDLDLKAATLEMAKSGRVWLVCAALALLTILMDFLNFLPLFFKETMKVEPGRAAMAGSVFPAGMFLALVATGIGYDRFDKKALVRLHAILLGVATLAVLSLVALPRLGLDPGAGAVLGMASVFVLGFSIAPAYYLPMSVFSIEFGGKHSGFLVALIDVFGYSGSLLFNWFGGSIAQNHGWGVFLAGLLAVAAGALVSMVAFLHLDARASR